MALDKDVVTEIVSKVMIAFASIFFLWYVLTLTRYVMLQKKGNSKVRPWIMASSFTTTALFFWVLYFITTLANGHEVIVTLFYSISNVFGILAVSYFVYFWIKGSVLLSLDWDDFTKNTFKVTLKTIKKSYIVFNVIFVAVFILQIVNSILTATREKKSTALSAISNLISVIIVLALLFWVSVGIYYTHKFYKIIKEVGKSDNLGILRKITKAMKYICWYHIFFIIIFLVVLGGTSNMKEGTKTLIQKVVPNFCLLISLLIRLLLYETLIKHYKIEKSSENQINSNRSVSNSKSSDHDSDSSSDSDSDSDSNSKLSKSIDIELNSN
ncbi:zcchc10 protein [Anaeramoeba flamelloides]|uniref:Zcchc10 protein n=1 Tax=Anaeramoeba flamelloides TaxID=1746091 RepID=A0AAV7YMU4_9EUKA|nr:zcchc10 protein [Anaeramoeba flamelloides]